MKDQKNIEVLDLGGIQCDNCDWEDNTALTIAELEVYLDKPCPNCGANLLTEDDLLEYAKFTAAIDTVNSMNDDEVKEFESFLDEDSIIDEYNSEKLKGLSQTESQVKK
jgi:phage FluMu protein Com